MNEKPTRRGHTRWLLLTPLVGLAVIIGGVVVLEAIHPQRDTDELRVEGLPPLAMDEDRECIRLADPTVAEAAVDEILQRIEPGDRISSSQVTACPLAYDGLEVTFVGEVVGELLPRRGGVWAKVNDDAYALEVGPVIGHRERAGFNEGMSVWIPDGLHAAIEEPGRPGVRGDVVLVQGTVLRADPDDGGGTTLRAEQVSVLEGPVHVEAPLHRAQIVVATVLALLAIGAVVWSRRVRRR
jgi:hypothetical protein